MKLKTILLQGTALFFCAALLISCETSKKGKWTSSEKEKARKEIEKGLKEAGSSETIFMNADIKKRFLDCSIEKLEKKYSSFAEADNDVEGCKQIGAECALSVVPNLLDDEMNSENMDEDPTAESEEEDQIDQ